MPATHLGLPVHAFTDTAAFEAWLDASAGRVPAIRLKLAKRGSPTRTLTKAEAIDAALCFGWIDGKLDRYDDH